MRKGLLLGEPLGRGAGRSQCRGIKQPAGNWHANPQRLGFGRSASGQCPLTSRDSGWGSLPLLGCSLGSQGAVNSPKNLLGDSDEGDLCVQDSQVALGQWPKSVAWSPMDNLREESSAVRGHAMSSPAFKQTSLRAQASLQVCPGLEKVLSFSQRESPASSLGGRVRFESTCPWKVNWLPITLGNQQQGYSRHHLGTASCPYPRGDFSHGGVILSAVDKRHSQSQEEAAAGRLDPHFWSPLSESTLQACPPLPPSCYSCTPTGQFSISPTQQ